jgi:hypothetical protein
MFNIIWANSSQNKSVVYFIINFLFVDNEFLRLMKSLVFHSWHTTPVYQIPY